MVPTDLETSKVSSKDIEIETEALQRQMNTERQLKIQAVNKLAEIMNRKDFVMKDSRKAKVTSSELRKKEKQYKKMQLELSAVSFATSRLIIFLLRVH